MAGWDWDLVVPLEGLEFPGPPPGPISARPGHELPRLRRLKAVGLMECVDFLAAVSCPRLEAVDLTDSPAPPVVFEEFCHRAELGRVRALALGAGERLVYQQRLRAHGALLLAAMPSLTNLRELHLDGQLIGDAGLYHLAHSAQLAGVEELYLAHNEIGQIGTNGIEELCTSLYLTRLRVLDLSSNPLGAAGIRELAQWPDLRRLRWLGLTNCGLTAQAIRPLAASPYLHDGLALAVDDNRFEPGELFRPGLVRRPASVS
jgi:Ran GTPase-activating protein (RanGAP) involved in mRNA processing and transport